jgi:farnesyl-diphosphate farnesyltransferase
MDAAASGLLTDLLKQVSRSFYLTMRVLPAAIRPQISVAYLLARTTDTVADTQIVPLADRLQALQALRERILGVSSAPLNFGDLVQEQDSPAEWSLLQRIEEPLALLLEFSTEDQQRIREVLSIITSGQQSDLSRFGDASSERILSLANDEELDEYTYRVAGCVGEFWTKICRAHLFFNAPLDDEFLLANSVRFGKGLQLVNILRDLPRDLRQGRCYLPGDRLWAIGLTPSDLLEPSNGQKLQPVFQAYLNQAEEHLASGWDYTNALPRAGRRVRLACAWPLLIGIRTVEELRVNNILAPEFHVKIRRSEVRKIIVRTVLCQPWPRAWARLFPSRGRHEQSGVQELSEEAQPPR